MTGDATDDETARSDAETPDTGAHTRSSDDQAADSRPQSPSADGDPADSDDRPRAGDGETGSIAGRIGAEAAAGARLRRRDLLRIGAAGATVALAGCWGDGDDGDPSTDDPSGADEHADRDDGLDPDRDRERERGDGIPYADEYGTVVDVVADAGADPTGEESIHDALESAVGDDTLLYFPAGRYLMEDLWTVPQFEHLGIVGADATIVPPQGYFGYLFVLGLPDRTASDLLFEGLDFDFTASDTAPRPVQAQVDDGLLVRDVSVTGLGGTARFDVTAPNGEGVVTGLQMPDGGREPNPVGILVGPANRGRLRFEDCHVEGFQGNGLYASPSNGPVEVVGGLYANNGIASVRVSSPATVRDVTVRCDEAPAEFRNMRGIRLRHGEDVLVENCTV